MSYFQYLVGQSGDDTYVVGKDAGLVFITGEDDPAYAGSADRVVFTDLTLADLTVGYFDYTATPYPAEGNALSLTWDDGTHQGELRIGHEGQHIETFQFADGSTVSRIALLDMVRTALTGTQANDTFHVQNMDDLFFDGAGGTGDTIVFSEAVEDYTIIGDNGEYTITHTPTGNTIAFTDVEYVNFAANDPVSLTDIIANASYNPGDTWFNPEPIGGLI